MVRRLVEQHDVKARDLQRRESRSRGLPARQRVERAVEELELQAQLRQRRVQACVGLAHRARRSSPSANCGR